MKTVLVSVLAFACCSACLGQSRKAEQPLPSEIAVGRDSFIDIGPPFNYYDLTILRQSGEKTEVVRVSLTPPADTCYPRVEIQVAHATLNEPFVAAIGRKNPCAIPERKLKSERKRRKQGTVFSGMNLAMQVRCVDNIRILRAGVLDRDIFDEHPQTPEHTAWAYKLISKLDEATGQSPWEKPIFPLVEAGLTARPTDQSPILQAIAAGRYDELMKEAPDRPSDLYKLAQNAPRKPFTELAESTPVRPVQYLEPVYPPIAKAARVHGVVEFHLTIAGDGSTEQITIDSGPKMLWKAVSDAIGKWKFAGADAGKRVHGSIRFGLNCAAG